LGIHGESPQVFVEDTLCRLEKRRIDSPNKNNPKKKLARILRSFCRLTTDVFVTAQLVPYEDLTALQRDQVEAIEIHPEQIKFSGDIHGALHTLLSRPGPGVKGFALLADDVPVAFLLLKRPPVLPAWADEHSATLHALQVDHRAQGKGYGKACLQALPAVARAAWPQIRGLELSVDADNDSAIGLYTRLGWVDSGEAYKGRIGYERRMGLVF
jgi:ribosomal protein S18 acetylase RimI-like enzyme